jgi:hypothetical protein
MPVPPAAPAAAPAQDPSQIGEHTQVGRAPAPDPRAPARDPRGPDPRGPAQGGSRETQLGFAHGGARPPPPPGARPAPSSSSDDLDTPVMPAMLGELVRAEPRADELEPPYDDRDSSPTVIDTAESRRRAAALPAAPAHRTPTMPPPMAPATVPGHRPPGALPATRLPALIAEASRPRAEDWTADAAASEPRREDSHIGKAPRRPEPADAGEPRRRSPIEDASSTEPSMPRFELPVQPAGPGAPPPPPAAASAEPPTEDHPWSSGLADRIDAVLQDEWANETPVMAPTKAELRALLGMPDPTRQQSLDELEALHRAADEVPSEPELLAAPPRRAPYPTTEVDPDQIEAAIELAPPARRRPNTNTISRPKKPE